MTIFLAQMTILCRHEQLDIWCSLVFQIDVPMPGPERKRSGILSHFTVVRNPEGTGYPIGWKKEVADRNSKNGCSVLSFENRYSQLCYCIGRAHDPCISLAVHVASSNIFFFSYCSERALLNRLFLELNKLDSDVLVGHNISRFDLDVLLQRAQAKQLILFTI